MSKLAKALTAAAGNAGGDNLYVEDVFSTYLYEGNATSTQTITNDIDLDGEGGLVWIKNRDALTSHILTDSEAQVLLNSNSTSQGGTGYWPTYFSFNSDGFTTTNTVGDSKTSGDDFASWTFRKAEKFFDVVTYTGTGSNQAVSHNLGSTPAVIIVKRTDASGFGWFVWHKDFSTYQYISLNASNAVSTNSSYPLFVSQNDSSFTVGTNGGTNGSGSTYVAYLFASDAGGFGDDGSESIIKCGSYTHTNGTATEVDVGFEPQWIIWRPSNIVSNWNMYDIMRGWTVDTNNPNLSANQSSAEGNSTFNILQNGFKISSGNDTQTGIYIAIRRPMKTPESGTEVFNVEIGNGGGSSTVPEFSAPFASDLFYMQNRNGGGANHNGSRLAGNSYLLFESTAAEASGLLRWDAMNGMYFYSTTDYIGYMFKRATGFFDVVAYTGDGNTGRTVNHNLGVKPELIISKRRNVSDNWWVGQGFTSTQVDHLLLLQSSNGDAVSNDTYPAARYYNEPTSTSYTIVADSSINGSGDTYIAYLFATLPGVSKVGSYTGTGSNVDVDCGFSAGARFILIKRTDSTGDWYVYDSERGIVTGNDPYLFLNSTAAEVTSTDYIDPLASGFTVTSSAPAALNASGGTYLFMAIS